MDDTIQSSGVAMIFIPTEAQEATKEKPVSRTVPERLLVLESKSNFWANALSIEHDRLHSRQRMLGYPIVVITAVTGVAAFTQLSDNPAWWATLTVAVFAFIAAGLAALQTQADFATRATAASESSAKFGTMYGTMLGVSDDIRAGKTVTPEALDTLYADYEAMKKDRPPVPAHVRAEARAAVLGDLAAMKR